MTHLRNNARDSAHSAKGSDGGVGGWAGAVWLTGQTDLATQLRDGDHVSGTRTDRELIPPAIATEIITRYTQTGDLVLDPDCGAGTVLVAALRAGRPALGLTPTRRWWTLARANVTAAKRAGAWADGSVLDRRPDTLNHVRAAGIRGTVPLALIALRRPDRPTLLADLTTTLSHTVAALHPAGHLAIVITPWRDRHTGVLADLPAVARDAATAAGLVLVHHAIALTGRVHNAQVHSRAGLDERRRARTHPTGKPVALIAHRDVLIFRPANHAAVTTNTIASAAPAAAHRPLRTGAAWTHLSPVRIVPEPIGTAA